jgi:hypothetical protein
MHHLFTDGNAIAAAWRRKTWLDHDDETIGFGVLGGQWGWVDFVRGTNHVKWTIIIPKCIMHHQHCMYGTYSRSDFG